MATKLISIAVGGVNDTVAAGDKLVIRSRNISGDSSISLSVFPAAGATARVYFTHSPMDIIAANPDSTAINWLKWPNGDVTNASADELKEDTLTKSCKAIKVEATGGSVIVQGSI
jgi:hypothetical protein